MKKELNIMANQTFSENGFTFEVSENGTVTAEGRVGENPASRSGMNSINPNGYDSSAYDKGHLIAARHGGPAKEYNVSAQERSLNRGAYKSVENAEVRLANRGYEVQTSKTAYVSNFGERPDTYMVNDTIATPQGNTQSVHLSFQNESPLVQEARNNESVEAFSQMAEGYPNPGSRPEGMDESEYAQLMESTECDLNSVKSEFDMNGTTQTTFDGAEEASFGSQTGAGEGCDDGCDGGCDDGCGM